MRALLAKFIRDESGVTSIEYAILLSLMVIVGLGAWTSMGSTVQNLVERTCECLRDAGVVSTSA